MPDRAMHFQFVNANHIGYGRMGSELARSFERLGIRCLRTGLEERYDGELCEVSLAATTPWNVPGWFDGQQATLLTMWETVALPEKMKASMFSIPLLLVPSQQNVELFGEFHNNVKYVPLGIDPDVWHYQPRQPPTREFTFLLCGGGHRKGGDLAIEAFNKVFGGDSWMGRGPRPKLIIKAPNPDKLKPRGNVQIIPGFLSSEDEVNLYASAHCYLQPSRGEGWGLQPLQAIAQGIPTILTNAHGQAAFAELGYGLDTTIGKSDFEMMTNMADWWEPDFDQLCMYMEYVYDNYEEALGFARLSSAVARDVFTWDNSARAILDLLPGDLTARVEGERVWARLPQLQYRIRTIRPYRGSHGAMDFNYEPGVDYFVPEELKRILYYNAVPILDPECVYGDNTGLTEEDIKARPDYARMAMYCPCCGQLLNSGPKRSDDEVLAAIGL